jgi:hypothetical protein
MTGATVMKWVGGATAVLSLLFALERIATSVSDSRTKRNQTVELLRTAALQRQDRHYDDAWRTLQKAEAVGANTADVRAAEEDVGMEWLRNISVVVGQQTFADIVHQVQPILVRGTLGPNVKRRADLTAHLGWADFLLWKEKGGDLHPEEQYRRAVALDSTNAYAHAMWGHWILYRHGSMDEARTHFSAAIRSGTNLDVARDLQVSALKNLGDSTGDAEMLRVASEMQKRAEPASVERRRRMAGVICLESSSAVRTAGSAGHTVGAVVSPQEDLAAIQWLFADLPMNETQVIERDYCRAAFEEAAGQREQALAMFKSVRARLPKFSELQPGTDAAIRRLSAPSSHR